MSSFKSEDFPIENQENRLLSPFIPNSLADRYTIDSWSGEKLHLFDNAAEPYEPSNYAEESELLMPPNAAQNFRFETVEDNPCVLNYDFYFGKGQAVLKNQFKYTGDMEFSMMHGNGVLEGPDFTYEGTFFQNEMQGRGRFDWKDSHYEGEVSRGVRNGFGTMKFANGNSYIGYWKDGLRHGKGKVVFPSGQTYDGEWVNGKKQGFGKLVYASGAIYEGNFVDDVQNGQGTMLWENQKYTGEWKNGNLHGKGTHIWLDTPQNKMLKNRYVGDWNEGLRHGYGVFYYANGSKYEGQWKNGRKHGQGKMIFEDGTMYIGLFKQDHMVDRSVSGNSSVLPSPDPKIRRKRPQVEENPIRNLIDISDLTDIEEDPGRAEREVFNILLSHFSSLKLWYAKYCAAPKEEVNIMNSQQFWNFLIDSQIVSYRIPIAHVNRIILQSTRSRFSVFESDEDNNVHSGERPVLFRHFVEGIVRVSFLKYSNGGKLESDVTILKSGSENVILEKPKSQIGIALLCLFENKLLKNIIDKKENFPETPRTFALESLFRKLSKTDRKFNNSLEDQTVAYISILNLLQDAEILPLLISVEELIALIEENHDPEERFTSKLFKNEFWKARLLQAVLGSELCEHEFYEVMTKIADKVIAEEETKIDYFLNMLNKPKKKASVHTEEVESMSAPSPVPSVLDKDKKFSKDKGEPPALPNFLCEFYQCQVLPFKSEKEEIVAMRRQMDARAPLENEMMEHEDSNIKIEVDEEDKEDD